MAIPRRASFLLYLPVPALSVRINRFESNGYGMRYLNECLQIMGEFRLIIYLNVYFNLIQLELVLPLIIISQTKKKKTKVNANRHSIKKSMPYKKSFLNILQLCQINFFKCNIKIYLKTIMVLLLISRNGTFKLNWSFYRQLKRLNYLRLSNTTVHLASDL